MTEHLDSHTLGLFMDHKLAPSELLRAAQHIGVCESCRKRIGRAERTDVRIENLRTELKEVELHLDYEQLAAYVDGTLDAVERKILSNHLNNCSSCALEERELRSFREELVLPNNSAELPSERWWHRFSDSLRMSRRVAWVTAVVLIAMATVVLLLWQRGKRPEVAKDNSNNNANTSETVSNGNQSLDNRSVSVKEKNAAPYAAVIKRTLETHKLDRALVLRELAGRPSTLMGRSNDLTFDLFQPVGTVTMSNRPIFRWQPLAGATSYQVHVLDTEFKVVAESGPITATSWSPQSALDRGVVYLWQVSAVRDGEVIFAPAAPRSEARFKILTGSETRKVRRAVKAWVGSPLERGIIYAHAGLLDDAEREFNDALGRTQDAAIARKLLPSLRALRR